MTPARSLAEADRRPSTGLASTHPSQTAARTARERPAPPRIATPKHAVSAMFKILVFVKCFFIYQLLVPNLPQLSGPIVLSKFVGLSGCFAHFGIAENE